MRFQAQISVLQFELEQKNELIAELEKQLEASASSQPSQLATSPPVVIQSASLEDDPASSTDSDDDDFGGTVRYFAVIFQTNNRETHLLPSSWPTFIRHTPDGAAVVFYF